MLMSWDTYNKLLFTYMGYLALGVQHSSAVFWVFFFKWEWSKFCFNTVLNHRYFYKAFLCNICF